MARDADGQSGIKSPALAYVDGTDRISASVESREITGSPRTSTGASSRSGQGRTTAPTRFRAFVETPAFRRYRSHPRRSPGRIATWNSRT